jgi:hypothetical protein
MAWAVTCGKAKHENHAPLTAGCNHGRVPGPAGSLGLVRCPPPPRFSGKLSASPTPLAPADVSIQSPRALKMESSHREQRWAGEARLLGWGGSLVLNQ